ncbi:Saccharopine dehydrogenase [Pseudovibrio sp. Ad13]|uniref:SDR family oxidoreductase n=1 Tax=Pseudovibrio sp. Ad13 TaxID=989396 RepID=UPI0007AE4779|nr:SDR family oxidoreductase [Pseudovibrio sp. Ad13]KZK86237.1 Saccharopine dehydrogenase [Pseudovibrio sp. Ad13]
MKILVLGGYGVFGGRLIELLLNIESLEIVVSGRDRNKAEDFCKKHSGDATLTPLALDRTDIALQLPEIKPDIVIDASGPFQAYGQNRYVTVEACIAAKVNYLDFADAADFVFGVSQFDQQAKTAGIFVISGVSSFPVLTASVLREISKTMEIHHVTGGIAPSPFAGVGLNVMRAIVGYAGSPITLFREGKRAQAIGLAETRRYTISVPGKLPMRNTHFSLVDVPDLQVLPPEHPTMQSIWMGAGPIPEVLHKMLNWMARVRSTLRLPSFEPLSPLFYRVLNLFKYGEHRGGMFVHVSGSANKGPVEQSWHMLAEGDDGPYIPSMAIEAIIRKILAGEVPKTGARSATRELELEDYSKLFEKRPITMGFRQDQRAELNPFKQVLGSAFNLLPTALQNFHGSGQKQTWQGQAVVHRGSGLLSKMIGRVFGFPKTNDAANVCVTQIPDENGLSWTRSFDGKEFESFLKVGRGKDSYLLSEQFGPVKVALALVLDEGKLRFIPRRWSIFSIPMPRILLPHGESFEQETDGRFSFDVQISAPVVGHIVSYKGYLEPET